MHGTAWSKKSSALTSDRLRPASRSASPAASSGKGKGKQAEVPKSAEVRRLEALLSSLVQAAPTEKPHPSETCFCQARVHKLSVYTPICTHCGLILCTLHPAHLPCPHCAAPLLTAPQRTALLADINAALQRTLAQEEAARAKALEDARAAAGAFPVLGRAHGAAPDPAAPHKVLSLNAKTKRVTVASYMPPADTKGKGTDAAREAVEEVVRVQPPPDEVAYVAVRRGGQVWVDLRGGGAKYVDAPKVKKEGGRRSKGQRAVVQAP